MKLSRAEVPTEHAVSYVRQLSRHWAHKMPVELAEDGRHSKITLPKAVCHLLAAPSGPAMLSVYLELPDGPDQGGDQEHMEKVLEEHLQRFGFRETLTFHWLRS